MDPDKKLREMVLMLKPDGMIYISVPTWFETMTCFGVSGWDLEYYYDTNHINVWTKSLFETLLKKAGLKIIMHDGVTYDETYLCVRDDSLMEDTPVLEDPKVIEKVLGGIFEASKLYENGKIKESLGLFPDFPQGWISYYEKDRSRLHKDGQPVTFQMLMEEYVEPMMKATSKCYESFRLTADIAMRYEHYQAAIEQLKRADEMRPGKGDCLMAIAQCFFQSGLKTKETDEAHRLFKTSADICLEIIKCDPQALANATNLLYSSLSQLPISIETQEQ